VGLISWKIVNGIHQLASQAPSVSEVNGLLLSFLSYDKIGKNFRKKCASSLYQRSMPEARSEYPLKRG
jgi:hypothetical protein